MREILVDSNVILDVVTEDTTSFEWSSGQLARLAEDHALVINPIVYSEVSVGFEQIEDVDAALPADFFRREALPWEAAFLAARCFLRYRRAGGRKRSPLPDFYVGAHAAVRGLPLLTRDARRYRSYFPRLTLVAP
ncbi:MAG: type II toxin-antitoxin system VapC family toxin [Candidatus Rokubacteria bacterium]|nr:type II toxin-antitoxin system VapC family toxin [Candidatus Rokubacteria bacterium]